MTRQDAPDSKPAKGGGGYSPSPMNSRATRTPILGSLRLAFATLRTGQWLHFLALPCAAIHPDLAREELRTVAGRLFLGQAVAACALGYAYGLNAIADRKSDASAVKNPVAGIEEVPFSVRVLVWLVGMLAVALGALGTRVSLFASLVSVSAATVYSAGPRWKGLPIVGSLLNVVMFGPLLAVSLGASTPPSLGAWIVAFAALLVQNQLMHERADLDEDLIARDVTTARLLGDRGTAIAVAALAVAGGVFVAATTTRFVALFTVATLAGGAYVGFSRDRDWAARRRLHGAVAIAGGAAAFASQWLSR